MQSWQSTRENKNKVPQHDLLVIVTTICPVLSLDTHCFRSNISALTLSMLRAWMAKLAQSKLQRTRAGGEYFSSDPELEKRKTFTEYYARKNITYRSHSLEKKLTNSVTMPL